MGVLAFVPRIFSEVTPFKTSENAFQQKIVHLIYWFSRSEREIDPSTRFHIMCKICKKGKATPNFPYC